MLEAVVNYPHAPTKAEILAAVIGPDYTENAAYKMVDWLRGEGLLVRGPTGQYALSEQGLDYLLSARFDIKHPEPGIPRPKARKPRKPRKEKPE